MKGLFYMRPFLALYLAQESCPVSVATGISLNTGVAI